MSSILILIDDYLEIANRLILKLSNLLGYENLMGAWRSGKIAKSNQIQDIYYQFHGVGIYIETEKEKIEIDFVPHGKIGGFDAWRLWEMMKLNSRSYPGITNQQDIQNELENLIKQKKITPVLGTNLFTVIKN